MRIICGALFAMLAAVLPATAQRGNPVVEYEGQSVDQMIAAFMKENKVPGMAVAIVQAPYIPRITGYGLSDAEHQRLSSSHTLFNVGEMVEAYTGVAILQLVEDGKLELEKPVSQYLDGLPEGWKEASVRSLLVQLSGIPNYPDDDVEQEPKALLAKIATLPLEFAPGTKFQRSRTNQLLLQLLVERVSGVTFQEFVRERQFAVLGLKATYFASELGSVQQEALNDAGRHSKFLSAPALINPVEVATGYESGGDSLTPVPAPKLTSPPFGTAIYASAMDISVWDIGLAGEILIKNPELRKVLYQPAVLANGERISSSGPWLFPGHPGLMMVSGSDRGFSSFLSRFTDPKDLLCVTLLANREGLDLEPLARKIAGAYDLRLGPKK